MQMFLWLPPGGYQVQVTSGPVGNYAAARANFGAFLSDIFVTQPTADVVLATPNNACAPLVGFPAGSIAYADAGGCNTCHEGAKRAERRARSASSSTPGRRSRRRSPASR